MATHDEVINALEEEFAAKEAGVAEALELYLRVEDLYVKATEALVDNQDSSTSSSTNFVSHEIADLG